LTEQVVVVGAGQAGAALVAQLRAEGFPGRITLVGAEPDPPYQRPPLSKKYLLGALERERLYLKPARFYEDERIELVTGTSAAEIDRRRGRVVLSDGRALPYDRLALTTGAIPRRLPQDIGGALGGVHVVRTLSDVDGLAPEVAPGRRALVIGGGYIGLEAAAVLAERGLATTLVELAPRILNRVACAETADAVRALHLAHGVTIREGTGLARLDGAGGQVREAVLADGERLPADLVIVGIGVVPDTGLAETAGLAIDNGIAVDGLCRSSDPAILAAGDCASFPYEDRRIRLESVQNAIDQAEHAARVMTGTEAAYAPCPWFWSDQYDARLQIAGLSAGHDRVVSRPGHRESGASFWYFRGPRLIAVDALNDPKAYMQGKRWIERAFSPDPVALADPDRPLKALAS
jgi:3-phenylpropionate/trans-cinnamate dioxygenase ferredoxin reductase subunit